MKNSPCQRSALGETLNMEFLVHALQTARGIIFIIYCLLNRFGFILVRSTFNLCRYVMWHLSGTWTELAKASKDKNCKKSAQVLRIVWCSSLDYVLPASLSDFILVHERMVEPEFVLADNVSLFFLDKDLAVFAECDQGVQIWRSNFSAFVKTATYKHARNLIIMPINSLKKLSDFVGQPRQKLCFLFNTARCGSTLAVQIFEKTDRCVAISEPDIFPYLVNNQKNYRQKEYKQICKNVINLLCKPVKTPQDNLAYVIKLHAHAGAILPVLFDLYPDASFLFLYRHVTSVSRSVYRAIQVMPVVLLYNYVSCFLRIDKLGRKIMAIGNDFTESFIGIKGRSFCLDIPTKTWCVIMNEYRTLYRINPRFRCLRYEDIVKNTHQVVRAMFSFCGLPEHLVDQGLLAMKQNSHKTSILSGVSNFRAPKLTLSRIKRINEILEAYDLPNIENCDVQMPGLLDITGFNDILFV